MTTKTVLAPIASTLARSALMLCAVAAVAAPVSAADMKGEYGARTVGSYPAVPVPAPIPVPETFNWYVRGDAGYSLRSSGNLSVTGTPQISTVGPSDQDGPYHGSLGMGRYVTPSLRIEFGLDLRNQQTIGRPKPYMFSNMAAGPVLPGPVQTIDTNYYTADRRDNTTLTSHSLMVNAYYDIKTGGMFTPYIGAGAGLSFAQMRRSFTESAACTYSTNSDPATDALPPYNLGVDPVTGQPIRGCAASAATYAQGGGHKGVNDWGPALALMAGTAVQLRPGVSLDAGYRLMWQGSTPSIAMGSVMGDISKIAVGSRTDHELRMGLRWDIW